jgi:hypothetical protein
LEWVSPYSNEQGGAGRLSFPSREGVVTRKAVAKIRPEAIGS